MAVPTGGWNENYPAGTDVPTIADDCIRQNKAQTGEVGEQEHDWPRSGTATGRHKIPFTTEAALPTTNLPEYTGDTAMLALTTDRRALMVRKNTAGGWVPLGGIECGVVASRPTATDQRKGLCYYATDEGVLYLCTGAAGGWVAITTAAYTPEFLSDPVLYDDFTAYQLHSSGSYYGDWVLQSNYSYGTPPTDAQETGGVVVVSCGWAVQNNRYMVLRSRLCALASKDGQFAARAKLDSAADQQQQARLGLATAWGTTQDPTDGIFFRRADAGSPANWYAVTRASSTEEANDTGIAGDTSYRTLRFVVSSTGTSVAFYVDDVLKATNTTNIPSGLMSVGFKLDNTEAAEKKLYVDAIKYEQGR